MSAPTSRLTPSQRLRLDLLLAEVDLNRVNQAFWRHRGFTRIFPGYLLQLHAQVKATVPLCRTAQRRARELAASDPLARALAPYFELKVEEELHHDEWLLEDMAVVGVDASAVETFVPPTAVAELVGCQYYWILHAHPVALLGFFAVFEGAPPTVAVLDRLAARTRLPRAALRTFYKHAELDPGHRDELDELLDTLPLQPWHEDLLRTSAFASVEQGRRWLEEVVGRRAPQPASALGRPRRAR